MPVESYQLVANAKVTVGDSEGTVIRTDNDLTCVAREDGSVDWYTTDYVRSDGQVTKSEAEQNQVTTDQQRITELEAEIEAIRGAETPGPAATSQQTPASGDAGSRQQTA